MKAATATLRNAMQRCATLRKWRGEMVLSLCQQIAIAGEKIYITNTLKGQKLWQSFIKQNK